MENEFVTFTVKSSDGQDVEMAIVDEFDFENKHYIVAARVIDDAICNEGQYIYRAKIDGDDFTAEKVSNHVDYERIVKAYMDME